MYLLLIYPVLARLNRSLDMYFRHRKKDYMIAILKLAHVYDAGAVGVLTT